MPYMLVRHKVTDYAKWKPVFDAHSATRRAGGSKGVQLFRNRDDPNEILTLLAWDDLDKAKQFAQSEDLRQAMERAGVADQPDIFFLNEIERQSA